MPDDRLNEYLDTVELSGVTYGHIKEVKRFLTNYLAHLDYSIDKGKSLQYFKQIKENNSISYYRKQLYQILKFLTYLKIDWSKDIKPPADPIYYPKRISQELIHETIRQLRGNNRFLQYKAMILLGTSSGMRPQEIYQLTTNDIDVKNRIIYINHNPENGQTTKTKKSRITFITEQAQQALSEYLTHFENDNTITTLFAQTSIKRVFLKIPLRVKDLRKFFSQEWDRRGGPTSIKKILMGHSLRNDVDLMHYNAQSPEDLKQIYDKVMGILILKDD
ncbi:MAG: tyrosine-type recombinase/integrase [Thermoplasmatales archaeon]|nr:MAG: tyrosine-type recombinase/integrase [Thermoplasmatales archaeon]